MSELLDVTLADLNITEHGDEARPLDLLDPRDNTPLTRNGKPWRVYVLSTDAQSMTNYDDAEANKLAKKGRGLTASDMRKRGLLRSAKLISAKPWENIPDNAGEDLPFNAANAYLLVSIPWLRRQVETFASAEGNFLASSPSSSPSTDDTSSD